MFPNDLQFEPTNNAADTTFMLPPQCLCLRQTFSTLEFLRKKDGRTGVLVVEGRNLGILRRAIIHGACTLIQCGPYGPAWSGCAVTRIYHRLGWTLPKYPLAVDPNPMPPQFWQIETGHVRDMWRYDHLTAFAVARVKRLESFMAQFHEQHAYVLDSTGTFAKRLAYLKANNLKFGTVNRFTKFGANRMFPATHNGYVFKGIIYQERNLAARSDWDVILDFRDSPAIRPSMTIAF